MKIFVYLILCYYIDVQITISFIGSVCDNVLFNLGGVFTSLIGININLVSNFFIHFLMKLHKKWGNYNLQDTFLSGL